MSAASRSTKGPSQRSRTAGTSGHGSRTASKAGVGGAGKPAKDSGDVLKAREKEYRYSAVSSCPRLLGRLQVEGVSRRWGCPDTHQNIDLWSHLPRSLGLSVCLPIKALLCIASYEHRQKSFGSEANLLCIRQPLSSRHPLTYVLSLGPRPSLHSQKK